MLYIMSADFTKVLVKDDRLDVTDNIKYAVIKGGQNMTCAPFSAISESGSQLTFNVQVPSEQTIIDRRVLLETLLTVTVKSKKVTGYVSTPAPNTPVYASLLPGEQVGYGQNMALAPFPVHQSMTVMSATVNNNTVSINIRDVLPALTRLLDKRELACYNGTTPTYLDGYSNYVDSQKQGNNPLDDYTLAIDSDIYPRGAFQPVKYSAEYITESETNDTLVECFQFLLTEPLLLSPFIYANPQSNAQGFYGIQNLNFIFNIGDVSRVWRGPSMPTNDGADGLTATSSSPSPSGFKSLYISDVQAGDTYNLLSTSATNLLSKSRLLFQFLTPHPSDMMPARNIVPYYELPRYISQFAGNSVFSTGASYNLNANSLSATLVPSGGSRISSQSLQLNQIPDKLIIFLRKQLGSQKWGDADVAFPIQNISINFNNNSGLLASAQVQDLYKMAKDNGNNQNWLEWSGVATNTYSNGPSINLFDGVPTVGSYITLEFGKDIQLVEDFYAPGSLGNFNLQVQIQFADNKEYVPDQLELVIVTMNSGVFVNERGTSSTYTGILTKADVLEASDQVAFTRSDVKRMVGGGFLDMIKSAVSKLAPVAKAVAPIAGDYLSKHSNPYAQMAGKVISGMAGHGASGGTGFSAGGHSGGGKQRLGKHLM